MTDAKSKKYDFKIILKYISTIVSWTFFALLSIIAVLLIYYFISSRLYAAKGEKYEPIFSVYTIVSGSMEPTIKVYDVIVNVRADEKKDIKINDVITFTSTNATTAGMTITHRVIGILETEKGEKVYRTKGDNNPSPDRALILYSEVLGKVLFRIPMIGHIKTFIFSRLGWFIVVVLPCLGIVVYHALKITGIIRKKVL